MINVNKKDLEIIEAYKTFTLYYDREDKSLWVYNGKDYKGVDAYRLYEWLISAK